MQMISVLRLRHAYEHCNRSTAINTKCLSFSPAKYSDLATWQVGTNSLLLASWDTCTWHHRWQMSLCLVLPVLVLALNQLHNTPKSQRTCKKEQVFRIWGHTRLATILCIWDTHTWHHRQVPNGVTNRLIICHSEDAYVSAPRDTYGQQQVKDLHIRRYTDKQPQSWLKHTYRQSFIIPTDTAGLL